MIFLMGTAGAAAEMLLLGHVGDWTQQAPTGMLVAAMLVVGWYTVSRSRKVLRVFRALTWLLFFTGIVGILLHYRANAQVAREMYDGLQGLNLFREAIVGSAPILEPGGVSLLGLLGWIYTFRHPVLLGKRAIGADLEPDHTAAHQAPPVTSLAADVPPQGSNAPEALRDV